MPSPSLCTVSGIIYGPGGAAQLGVVIKAYITTGFTDLSGNYFPAGILAQTVSAADGTWSLAVVQTQNIGHSVTFQFEYPLGDNQSRSVKYAAVIPNASSAVWSSLVNLSAGTAILAADPTTDALPEGVVNLYFTNARAQAAVSATAPLVDTAGVFSIPQASTSVSGFLSSTDWNTFNNKQSAGLGLLAANNLSDVQSASTSRTNLGLGTAAVQNSSAFAQTANNLSDLASASAARTNLGLGTIATQSASAYLLLSGGMMTGAINLGSFNINAMLDPTTAQQGATKNYVDNAVAALQPLASVFAASTGSNIVGTYSNGASGVGATFTITAAGALSMDGVSPALNSRVLLKDQTSGFQNGVYVVTAVGSVGVSPVLTRALDYDTAADMNSAGLIPITHGTLNALSSWQQLATITTVGTDALVFSEFTANPSLYLLKANNLSDVASAAAAFNNISPMTTTGDIIYEASTGVSARLGIGTTGQILSVVAGLPAWAAPATNGTVTSVGLSVPGSSIFGTSGSPVTTSGTLGLTTTGISGGIPYFSSSSQLSSSAALIANQIVIGGGSGGAPSTLAAGSQYQVLTMGASAPGYGAVNLAQSAAVTGVLPTGNGGSGTGTVFTQGSVVFAGASGNYAQDHSNFFWDATNHRLGIGTSSPSSQMFLNMGADDLAHSFQIQGASGANDLWSLFCTNNEFAIYNVDSNMHPFVGNYDGRAALSGANLGNPVASVVVQSPTGQNTWPTLVLNKIASQTADYLQFLASDLVTVNAKVDITGKGFFANIQDSGLGAGVAHSDSSGNFTSSAVVLTSEVSGVLPVANGGTNLSSTTANQLLYSSATNTIAGLATANGGVLNTSSSGVPSITATPALGVNGTTTGQLLLATSASSGASITVQNGGATTAYNFNLPTTPGTAGQVLTSQGGGSSAMTWGTGGGGGGVSAVSVASANGFAGSSSGGTTPALTLSTTITGVLQGNGTAISAATTTGTGNVVLATAPTITSISAGSTQISNVLDPTSAQQAATKNYVDTMLAALNPQDAVYAATTANIAGTYSNGVAGVGATFTTTSTATFTLDGTTPPLLSRILIKNQTSGFQNGIYTFTTAPVSSVSGAVFTRALDYNTAAEMNTAGLIPVINGTVNALSSWQQVATITTVGTDALVFSEFTANPSLYLLAANNLSDVASKATSFNNLSPMTSVGDLILGGASGAGARLAIGSTGNVLTVSGGTAVWAAPATSGTVTSVALTVPTFLSVSGSPITSSGTLAVTLSGTALPVANGGTGDTSLTAYAVLAGGTTSTGALQQVSGVGTSGQVLTSNGASALPTWQAPTAAAAGVQVGRYTNGTGVDSNTTLLMNFDQSPATDFSSNNWTVTSNNSPVISSTQAKFGSDSYFQNNSNSSIQTQAGAVGSGDFTVDFWAFSAAGWVNGACFANTQDGGGANWLIQARNTPTVGIWWQNSATGTIAGGGGSYPSNSVWHHFAFVRHSGTMTAYVDGVATGTAAADSENYTEAQLRIGSSSTQGAGFGGYIDEFRISNIARWTSNFTPPTAAYPTTSTIETNPGSWISSLSSASTGVCTVNFTGGTFAAEPVITVTAINPTGSGQATAQLTTTPSTSSVTVATYIGGVLANCDVEITAITS